MRVVYFEDMAVNAEDVCSVTREFWPIATADPTKEWGAKLHFKFGAKAITVRKPYEEVVKKIFPEDVSAVAQGQTQARFERT